VLLNAVRYTRSTMYVLVRVKADWFTRRTPNMDWSVRRRVATSAGSTCFAERARKREGKGRSSSTLGGFFLWWVGICGCTVWVCWFWFVLMLVCWFTIVLWCYVILRVGCGVIALVTIPLGVVFVVYFCVRCLLGVVRGWFGFYPVCGCGCCAVTVLLWVLEFTVVL